MNIADVVAYCTDEINRIRGIDARNLDDYTRQYEGGKCDALLALLKHFGIDPPPKEKEKAKS